jgi:hypothetical protein
LSLRARRHSRPTQRSVAPIEDPLLRLFRLRTPIWRVLLAQMFAMNRWNTHAGVSRRNQEADLLL